LKLNDLVTKQRKIAFSTAFLKIIDMASTSKTETKTDAGDKKKTFRPYAKKHDEKAATKLPILKYGKGNNFVKFKAALSEVALEEYGDLGRLIKKESYYLPTFTAPDYTGMGLTQDEAGKMRMDAMKAHQRKLERMRDDCPKLYGLILRHMSPESKDEVAQDPDYEDWSEATDPEKLWKAIVSTHKVDCVTSVDAVKELAARKAYQSIRQGSFETLAQYSERFRETFQAYKATEKDPKDHPIDVSEADQAMDFFHGLDDGRYGEFKQNVKNGWAMKSMNPPTTVNQIYRLAGVWVKLTARAETGTGATYHTEQRKTHQKEEGKVEEDKKPQKDLSKVKCYGCGKKGHMKNSPICPKNIEKQKRQEEGAGFLNAAWCEEIEGSMYATVQLGDEEIKEYVVDTAVNATNGIELTQVLLDNQADISVMHPMMLSDVRPAERRIRISGVGGLQLIVDKVGMLDGFFQVYASEHTKANVLSFADVEDKYEITYVRGHKFTVHMPEEDVVFERMSKLYVADWCVETAVNATVREREQLYTKEEIHRAKIAHEFLKCSGYPSIGEATHLITDGNVQGMPMLIKDDLMRAYEVYGEHPEYVRGKMTKKTVGRMKVDISRRSIDKSLRLSTDVMHVDGEMFLVTATEPLNLTLQSYVENEGKLALGMALQGQMAVLHTRGFLPEIVYTDPHSTFRSMTQDFPGVAIYVGGANDYVAKVDAKIRRIKETYRNVKLGLPWKLPKVLVKDL
jgi:hypothetical protein